MTDSSCLISGEYMFLCDDSFYQAQEIDGFYVSEMMKRFWASCIENLLEVDRICKKHNIKYFLYYGSLLGAVRHKGFIPWDDDLDIAMLRGDYDKFVSVAESEISEGFFFRHLQHDSCLYACCLHNTYYPQIDKKFLDKFHGCPYSSAMDIYPLDNLPDDKNEMYEFKEIYKVVSYIARRTDPRFKSGNLPECMKQYIDNPTEEEIEEVIQGIEEYLDIKIERTDHIHIDMSLLCEKLAKRYQKQKSKKVGYINDMDLETLTTGCVPKRCFDEIKYLEFEGVMMPVPADYEKVLECLYGKDWRVPIKGAASHDYPVYKGQAQQLEGLFNAYGAPAPDYFYL